MNKNEQWKKLSVAVDDRGGNGKQTTLAMQELYAEYSPEMWEWYAGLFDTDIGGFYYSNSARDTEGYLPDIESTSQATNAMRSRFHNLLNAYDELPEWMIAKMAEFTRSLEDPEDGYMYHKQWGKNILNSRRGRDLMWSEDMAKKLGFKFDYPTATERLSKYSQGENKDSNVSLPDYLKSEEAFLAYIKALDWDNRAYYSGNMLAAQIYQIEAAGLAPVATKFINSIQDPETGLWGKKRDYDAINAVLKINAVYNNAPMPNRFKIAMTIMDFITSDELYPHVTCQYNTFFEVKNILNNIDRFGEEFKGEREKIVSTLLLRAPDALRATIKKIRPFKKSQGSFSYFPDRSSEISQGAPAAVPNTPEGDVNATGICSGGMVSNIYAALDLTEYTVPRFGKTEYNKFFEILDQKRNK